MARNSRKRPVKKRTRRSNEKRRIGYSTRRRKAEDVEQEKKTGDTTKVAHGDQKQNTGDIVNNADPEEKLHLTPNSESPRIPIIYLTRCSMAEDLIYKQYNMRSGKTVLHTRQHKTGDMPVKTPVIEQPKGPVDRSTRGKAFMKSFKITTQLDGTGKRKIDLISVPVGTATTHNAPLKESKTQKEELIKKLPWKGGSYDKVLEGVHRITSSDSIFLEAFLKSDGVSSFSSPAGSVFSGTNSARSMSITSDERVQSSRKISQSESHVNCGIIIARKRSLSPPGDCDESTRQTTRSPTLDFTRGHSNPVVPPKRHFSENCAALDIIITVDSNSDSSTSPKQSNSKQLTVSKRVCEFKMPKLPMSKRPPTRITSSNGNFDSPVTPVRTEVHHRINTISTTIPITRNPDEDFDAISLYAKSDCLDLEQGTIETNKNLNCGTPSNNSLADISPDTNLRRKIAVSPTKNRTAVSERTGVESSNDACDLPNDNRCDISTNNPNRYVPPHEEDVLQTESPNKAFLSVNNNCEGKVNEWIASISVSKTKVKTRNVLALLKNLCFKYYKFRKCSRSRCHFAHQLPPDFQNTFRELEVQQFHLVLKEIVKFRYLFTDTFEMILMYFKERDLVADLIYFIQNILTIPVDKTPYVKGVILALKDMGLSFVEAVDEILLTHGRKTQSLLDILLVLIVEEDNCLENNWNFIDKLTKFSKTKLDYGVVYEIFQKCCNTETPNKEFCQNIYKDLIIKSHIDLDKIDRKLMIKYINLLYSFDLNDYAEQLKQNNRILDHEITPTKIVPKTPVEVVEKHDNVHTKSNLCCTSSSSTNTSASSASSQDNEQQEILKFQPDIDETRNSSQTFVTEHENLPNASVNLPNDENSQWECDTNIVQDNEQEQKFTRGPPSRGSGVSTAANLLEEPSQLFDYKTCVQSNQTYTKSDLDSYLNRVNKDIYTSTNVFRMDEPQDVNKETFVNKEAASPIGICTKPSPSITGSAQLDYEHSVSSESDTEKDLSDNEIVELVKAVTTFDLSSLFTIMIKAIGNKMSRSFVCHTITALRKIPTEHSNKFVIHIFESLENLLPHLHSQQLYMRNIMMLLAFNILTVLDRNKEYDTAIRLISIFEKDMDAFVHTECFVNTEWLSSTKLRRIFIFKILTRAGKLRDALDLLKSPSVCLFENIAEDSTTTPYKQRVLTEFINIALKKELRVAREALLYLMLNSESFKEYIDLDAYLNQLIVNLLNSYSIHQSELVELIEYINNGWYRTLKQSVLRAILVKTFYDLSEPKLMKFFESAVAAGVYEIHEGFQNSIAVPTGLLSEEIQLVLHVHFYKICKSNFPLENIVITLERPVLSDEYTPLLSIFTNSFVTDAEMITRILNVFLKFRNFPLPHTMKVSREMITIPYSRLEGFFLPYRTKLPPISKFK